MHHLKHLFLLGFVLVSNVYLEESTQGLTDQVVLDSERGGPALDCRGVLVKQLVVVRDTRVLLVGLAMVVLEAVLEFGVALGWGVVFEVVHGVGRGVDLAI